MQSGCNPLETVARTDVQDTPEDFSNWEFFLAQDADLRRCVESDSRTTMPSDMSQPCQPQPPPAQAVHASPVIGSRNRQAPTGLPPSGKSRLKAAQNRQAQQRLCAQQKARVSALEADLDQATCRLHEGQARRLEARNMLLQAIADNALKSAPSKGASSVCLNLVDAHQSITLTILTNEHVKTTVRNLSTMPFSQFATVYSAYVDKISACLSDTAQPCTTGQIEPSEELQRWTGGINRLRIFFAVGNAKNFVSFVASRLDGSEGPDASKLPASGYHSLIASLQLTESQKIGMMQVRRLFYAKLGAIRRQRQKLLQQVPLRPTAAASEASYDASSRLSGIALSAQQLQVNTDAELRAYLHVSAFLRLSTEGNQGQGILTTRQQALCIVKAFPYTPDKLRLLEELAIMRQEAPISVLTQPGDIDDYEHYANWQQIVHLLQVLTKENLHVHVPVTNL